MHVRRFDISCLVDRAVLVPHNVVVLDRNRTQIRARSRALEGRRVLDLAEGILIGLRRYSIEHAFEELVDVAFRHDMSVTAAAAALVDLASAGTDNPETQSLALSVAQREWRDLLIATSGQPLASAIPAES